MSIAKPLGNGVLTARGPRVAACEPLQPQPQAADRPVTADSLLGIGGTCRLEAAHRASDSRECPLIGPDHAGNEGNEKFYEHIHLTPAGGRFWPSCSDALSRP
jgi:hypothetical protein